MIQSKREWELRSHFWVPSVSLHSLQGLYRDWKGVGYAGICEGLFFLFRVPVFSLTSYMNRSKSKMHSILLLLHRCPAFARQGVLAKRLPLKLLLGHFEIFMTFLEAHRYLKMMVSHRSQEWLDIEQSWEPSKKRQRIQYPRRQKGDSQPDIA